MHRRTDMRPEPLEVQALYSIPALARVAKVTRQAMRRLILSNGLSLVRAGRTVLVPLSEIQRKLPLVWDSLLAAETLRAAAALPRSSAP